MKLASCFLTLLPGFAVAASWTSPGFPAFSEQGTGTFVSHAQLPKGTRPLTLNFDQQCWQPADAIKLNQMLSLQPCSNTPPQWRLFRDGKYTLQIDTRSGTPTLMISIQNAAEPVANLVRECPKWDGLPLTLDVSATFPEGAAVRDYYSQQIAIVKNGQITLQPA
ncbi:TPA: alpha-amylase, partial [Shigella flexneri]|nr:alpha-amylase [Shigella flexneri]